MASTCPGTAPPRIGLSWASASALTPTGYIAMVARFHPVKDHAMLLHAFGQAAARADVDLLLVGDGKLRGPLESLVASLGLTGRVRFLGVRPDVPDLLRAVDVFALTLVSEAASLTLLEAMASRLPVVVTAVGGNPEIVREGVEGLLVPRGTLRLRGQRSSACWTTPPRRPPWARRAAPGSRNAIGCPKRSRLTGSFTGAWAGGRGRRGDSGRGKRWQT